MQVFPGFFAGFVDLPDRANNPLASLHRSVPNYSKLRVIPHAKNEVGMSAGREGEPVVRSLFACSKLSLDIPGLQVCRVIIRSSNLKSVIVVRRIRSGARADLAD